MTCRPDMPCSPWATVDDVTGKCADVFKEDLDVLEKAIAVAQSTVFRLTFGVYTNSCETTFRPQKKNCVCSGMDMHQYEWGTSFPYHVVSRGDTIYNCSLYDGFGDCECGTSSSCVTLPFYPACEVVNITIDGVVLDPANYEIRDQVKICRTDGGVFPTCQDIDVPLGDVGSWSVTYRHGIAPPEDLVFHMLDYACELGKRSLDIECALPKRITLSRDAVIYDPMTFVKDGLTGWGPLDACIRSLNPKGVRRTSRAINPVKRRRIASDVRTTPPTP